MCTLSEHQSWLSVIAVLWMALHWLWPMSEYYEEGGLLYERSPPMHIKVESPEGAFGGRVSEDGFPREDDDSEGSCDHAGLPFNVVVVHPNIVAPGVASDELIPIQQSKLHLSKNVSTLKLPVGFIHQTGY